jgi:prephenate dehydrogenase
VIEQLAIIGAGLIGGSALRAAQRAGCARRIRVWDSEPSTQRLLTAEDPALLAADAAAAVRDADLILLCTPVGALPAVIAQIAHQARPGAIVSDVASVKVAAVSACEGVCAQAALRFVPAHPIAGSEQHGFSASSATLFDGKRVVLTPTAATDPAALVAVESFWRACGAHPLRMTVSEHDSVYAAVSHLPHLLAFAFTAALSTRLPPQRTAELAGSGLLDFTRIAGAEPHLWADICCANRQPLLDELGAFQRQLDLIVDHLRQDQREALTVAFRPGQVLRQSLRGVAGHA